METKKEIFANLKKSKYYSLIPNLREKKVQTFYSLTLTLIAVSICVYFAINPTVSTIVQLTKQLEDSKKIEQKLSEKISNLQTLQQKYNLIQQDLPLLYEAMPETPKVPPFQGQILAIAQNTTTTLTQLQTSQVALLAQKNTKPSPAPINPPPAQVGSEVFPPSPQTNTSPSQISPSITPSSFSFSVGIEGPYKNITDFLTTLVNFDRIATIDSLSIKPGTSKTAVWKATVSGKAYYYVDSVKNNVLTTPVPSITQ